MAMEMLWSQADPLYICLIKINSSWSWYKHRITSWLQIAPRSILFQWARISQVVHHCPLVSTGGPKPGHQQGLPRPTVAPMVQPFYLKFKVLFTRQLHFSSLLTLSVLAWLFFLIVRWQIFQLLVVLFFFLKASPTWEREDSQLPSFSFLKIPFILLVLPCLLLRAGASNSFSQRATSAAWLPSKG